MSSSLRLSIRTDVGHISYFKRRLALLLCMVTMTTKSFVRGDGPAIEANSNGIQLVVDNGQDVQMVTRSGGGSNRRVSSLSDMITTDQCSSMVQAGMSVAQSAAISSAESSISSLQSLLSTQASTQSELSALVSQLSNEVVPQCSYLPSSPKFSHSCTGSQLGDNCTLSCTTSSVTSTLTCGRTGDWIGVLPRCVSDMTMSAGAQNLAAIAYPGSSGGAACPIGLSGKIVRVIGRELILSAQVPSNCIFPGDRILVYSLEQGNLGVVSVWDTSADRYSIISNIDIQREVIAGSSLSFVRLASFGALTIPVSSTITTNAYDGSTGLGGVIAIDADNVALLGAIDASELGFMGGAPNIPPAGIGEIMTFGGGGGGASGHGCRSPNTTGNSRISGIMSEQGRGVDGSEDGWIALSVGGHGGDAVRGGGGGGAGFGFAFGDGGFSESGGNGGSKIANIGSPGADGGNASTGGGGGASSRDSGGGGGGSRPQERLAPQRSTSGLFIGNGASSGGGGGGGGGAGDYNCAEGGSGGYTSGLGGARGTMMCGDLHQSGSSQSTDGATGGSGGRGGGAIVLIAGQFSASSGSISATGGTGGRGGTGGSGAVVPQSCYSFSSNTPAAGGGGGGGGGGKGGDGGSIAVVTTANQLIRSHVSGGAGGTGGVGGTASTLPGFTASAAGAGGDGANGASGADGMYQQLSTIPGL